MKQSVPTLRKELDQAIDEAKERHPASYQSSGEYIHNLRQQLQRAIALKKQIDQLGVGKVSR